MREDLHQRAQQLLASGERQGLSEEQESWLRAHLQECPLCRTYEEEAGRIVRALRAEPLEADFALVEVAQRRVRLRSFELAHRQPRMWLVGLSCLFVTLTTLMTTPVLWRLFAFLGRWAGVSNLVWQTGFTVYWILPSLGVGALLLVREMSLPGFGGKPWR